MNDYEMVYIVSPRLSSEEAERATAWVDGLIRDGGGELLSTDVWGRRRLAYPIKHQFEGTYVYSTFRLEPQATRRIESELSLSESVLRHLMIRGIVEGGKPEAQSARVMAAGRQTAAVRPQPLQPEDAAAPGAEEAPAASDEAPDDGDTTAPSDPRAEDAAALEGEATAAADGETPDAAEPAAVSDPHAEDAGQPAAEATAAADGEAPDDDGTTDPADPRAESASESEPEAEPEPAGVE
ncbi:MAG: 30S ribosomal protein S6 [Chloroflexi bacterium]|nr:30S ribosomal protein S6 [Chloroflexota bacterium]